MAYLAKRLAETPEPGGDGSLLDNTLLVWTNELGKGNSHTHDNIPFVLVGGGLDFKMGRSLKYKREAAQPAAHVLRTRLRPSHQVVRQPGLLCGWRAGPVDVIGPGSGRFGPLSSTDSMRMNSNAPKLARF